MADPEAVPLLLRSAMTTLGHAMEVAMEEDPGVEDHIEVALTVTHGATGYRLTLKIEELVLGA